MKNKLFSLLLFSTTLLFSQSWQDVGGGLNSSSHGMCNWNTMLIDVGSFGSPCGRVAGWNGTTWNCFASGVGLVGRDAIEFNGDLVVVGDFWNVNQPCVGCNGIAKWDGVSWTPFGTGFNNDVLVLTIWNGQLVAAGDFTTADGNPCSRIARWNGTTWLPIGGLTDFDNDIRALAVYNGELWAGGDFSNVGGCTPCDKIVKWDGTAWVGGNAGVDIPGGLDSTVRVLYVNNADNTLYLGGHFLEVGGDFNCSRVAVYDGSVWTPLGTGVDDYVRGIMYYNGNIIVGGNFSNASTTPANKIAKWNYNTSTWSAMGQGMNDYVKAMGVYNSTFYAGGAFTMADGQPRAAVASWYETPNIPPVSMFTMSASAICLGQCVSFTDASLNTPTGWTWTFNGGTPSSSTAQNPTNICYNTAGTYTVTLTACNASGCNTSTQTITVSSTAIPVVTLNGNPNPVCSGSATTITASGATSYSWTPATFLSATTGASVTCTPTIATTYTVTGTTNGCQGTNTISITIVAAPTITVSPVNSVICSGSVNLTSSGGNSYTWSPATGLSATTGASVTATPAVTTIYTVTGTSGSGCTNTASATITIPGTNQLPLVEGFENPPYLPVGWAMIDDGNDGNIWQLNTTVGGFGASAQCTWFANHTYNAPGTRDEFRTLYLDFVSLSTAQMTFDVAYCRKNNASFSDTLSVWVSTDCGQSFSQIYLKGGTTLATGPNSNSFFTPTSAQWRTETINLNPQIGNNKVLFAFRNHNRNGNNLYLDNINITGTTAQPPVTAFSLSQNPICPGGCINFTDNSSGMPTGWTWTFTGGSPSSSTQQNPSNICYATAGTYTATLTACNASGCNTATQVVTVLSCVGLNEDELATLMLAPNPFSESTTLYFNGLPIQNSTLVIRDQLGRVVRTEKIPDGATQTEILKGGLYAGIYFIELMNNGKRSNRLKMILL